MRILLFLIFIFTPPILQAQSFLSDKNAVSEHAKLVSENLAAQEYDACFKALKTYWPLPENEIDQLQAQTIKQFNTIEGRFGASIGAEFVRAQEVGDFLLRKVYVLRFEKHLIRVLFTYYRNDEGWFLNSFKWDDDIGELFN